MSAAPTQIQVQKQRGQQTVTVATPVFDLWLARNDRPIAYNVDFLATQAERDANPRTLSSFAGLAFDALPPLTHAVASSHSGVQRLLNYIFEILANCDQVLAAVPRAPQPRSQTAALPPLPCPLTASCPAAPLPQASYEYIVGWMAAALQRKKKLGVMLVFIGPAGCGKSLLFTPCTENHPIFPEIYGGVEGYYMIGSGITDLVARFNVMSSSKLFAVCEEITSGSAIKSLDALKHLADSTHMTFEPKHADAMPQASAAVPLAARVAVAVTANSTAVAPLRRSTDATSCCSPTTETAWARTLTRASSLASLPRSRCAAGSPFARRRPPRRRRPARPPTRP